MIKKTTNYIIKSTAKPTLLDVAFEQNNRTKPIVVFVHGFKGFKDWGHFNLVHQRLAESGFVALKFNFSHNGGTLDNPIDFPDLEAFGNNTYTKELDDLGAIIDWVSDDENPLIPQSEKDVKQISNYIQIQNTRNCLGGGCIPPFVYQFGHVLDKTI